MGEDDAVHPDVHFSPAWTYTSYQWLKEDYLTKIYSLLVSK